MGWRIRYLGGESRQEPSLTVMHPSRTVEQTFETGHVYDIEPREARDLFAVYPDAFERVYPIDQGYAEPEAIPEIDVMKRAEEQAKFVPRRKKSDVVGRLRVLENIVVPGVNGVPDISMPAGAEFPASAEQIAAYTSAFPDAFEVITTDS